ncbi:MAG: hypothetical protein AAFX99_09750 [Myxococcota bacterium]
MSLDASTDEGERRTWVWLSVNGETLHWTFPQESSEQGIPRTLRCVVAGEHVYFEKLDYTDGIEGEAWVHDSLLMAMPLGESELVELLRTPNLDFDEHRRSAIGPWVPWRGGLALVLQGTGAQHKLVMSDGTREGTRVFEGWEQAPLAIEAIVAGDNRLWLDARTRESGEELWVVE